MGASNTSAGHKLVMHNVASSAVDDHLLLLLAKLTQADVLPHQLQPQPLQTAAGISSMAPQEQAGQPDTSQESSCTVAGK